MERLTKRKRARTRGKQLKGFRYDEAAGVAYFSVYIPGGGGDDRRRTHVAAASLDEAIQKWMEFRARALRGDARPSVTLTFREYIAAYFDDVAAQVAPRTARDYRYIIDGHLLAEFGSRRLDEFTAAAVKTFETKLRKRGYSLSSVNGYTNILLLLLHRAVDEFDLLDEFPIKKRLKRRKPAPLALELTDDERAQFFAVFEDETRFRADLDDHRVLSDVKASDHFSTPRRFGASVRPDSAAAGAAFARFRFLRPLFVVAVESGLRRGDLLRLSWRSIDWAQKWITITMEKTKLPVTIPISEACHAALQECRARGLTSSLVFTDEEGRPLSETRVKRTFDRAKRLAGITRRFRFHDLRHTFASRLASRNVSLGIISKAMGHTTIAMTMRYARPSQEAMRDITRALDD